jgi:hypothetical protein
MERITHLGHAIDPPDAIAYFQALLRAGYRSTSQPERAHCRKQVCSHFFGNYIINNILTQDHKKSGNMQLYRSFEPSHAPNPDKYKFPYLRGKTS